MIGGRGRIKREGGREGVRGGGGVQVRREVVVVGVVVGVVVAVVAVVAAVAVAIAAAMKTRWRGRQKLEPKSRRGRGSEL